MADALQRVVRRARGCDATAPNLVRVAAEIVGGSGEPIAPPAELGSPVFGFSPLWLIARVPAAGGRLAAVEAEELEASLAELEADEPDRADLDALGVGVPQVAVGEDATPAEVSEGIGLAFLVAARKGVRERLDVSRRDEWAPREGEGFADYAGRVGPAYRDAVAARLDAERPTWTEHVLGRISHDV